MKASRAMLVRKTLLSISVASGERFWRVVPAIVALALLAAGYPDEKPAAVQSEPTAANRLLQNAPTAVRSEDSSRPPLKGILASPKEITAANLRSWAAEGANSTVLIAAPESTQKLTLAIRQIRSTRMGLYYWIEVARDPALAEAHPAWMASLQGHPEWRRHFPNFPATGDGEVVKNYPWVPIVYQEGFDAHFQRISNLLRSLPAAHGVFLNDLQSAPSACGCGNLLCRWTSDYGPIHTATRLPADAAARFASAVAAVVPRSRIIPVWTTECEEMDREVSCAGVGCFAGLCWKEYTAQLMPVASRFERIGVLLPFRNFERDLPRYGSSAGWVKHALNSFREMPPKRQGNPVPIGRLIPILQGWDVTIAEQQAQIRQSREAGAGSYVMAISKIDQDWEPRIMKAPKSDLQREARVGPHH